MVKRLAARVLLDTGPSPAELDRITALFDEIGMDVTAEGHSYGGPPPTSAFLMVVNAPLVSLLDQFTQYGEDAARRLRHVVTGLHALRADPRAWGRPHAVRFEDAHNGHFVTLPASLPEAAYRALVAVDFAVIDNDSPVTELRWHAGLHRWQLVLTTATRRLARRAPTRGTPCHPQRVGQLSEAAMARLTQLAGTAAPSAVTWQRACVVFGSALGHSVDSLARQLALSPQRVADIIGNFNRHGVASFDLGYDGGEPVHPSPDENKDAAEIAATPPAEFGIAACRWSPAILGEFLLAEGVAEDVDRAWLTALLTGSG